MLSIEIFVHRENDNNSFYLRDYFKDSRDTSNSESTRKKLMHPGGKQTNQRIRDNSTHAH